MATGKCRWFDSGTASRRAGFGFLIPDDGGKDIFVHRTDIKDGKALDEGEKVEFEIVETPRGQKAVNVRRA